MVMSSWTRHQAECIIKESCKVWAEKAISVANWMNDHGAMKDVLMERYSRIIWKDQE